MFRKTGYEFSEVAVDAITGQRFELHQGNTDLLLIKLVKHDYTITATNRTYEGESIKYPEEFHKIISILKAP